MKQAEEIKLDGFLIKPVNPSVLFNTVMQALNVDSHWKSPKRTATFQELCLIGKILLVEDNSINQQLAQEILTSMGTAVCCADNGRQALTMLNEQDFDLVLMDIQMPEMDGYEITRRIRAEPRYREMPVIAMTAHAMVEEWEKCLDAGMNGHVAKPIDPEALFNTLKQWLKTEKRSPIVTGQTGTVDTDERLPEELPGIDMQWGLERIGGNRKLYRKLLTEFFLKHGNALKTIESLLAEGDKASVRRELHTLQGVAGNIGARALQKAAQAYESCLMQGKAVADRTTQYLLHRIFVTLFQVQVLRVPYRQTEYVVL
jgi:CheY-like chemotaxis protein/HPt (histidine-containing phosphotransfer) domain-containing protein